MVKKYSILSFLLVAGPLLLFAQDSINNFSAPVTMATGLRAEGKIYVVVAVLLIVLAGLFIYLIRLDRRITLMEQEKK